MGGSVSKFGRFGSHAVARRGPNPLKINEGLRPRLMETSRMMTTGRRHGTVATDRVKLDLLRVPNEFGHDDGVVRRHVRRVAQERRELRIARRDLHRRAAEDERGPHQNGVLDLGGEGLRRFRCAWREASPVIVSRSDGAWWSFFC